MLRNDLPFSCRTCPSQEFEICPLLKYNYGPARYIGVCKAKNLLVHPQNTNNNLDVVNKENISKVYYEPVENCPHVQNLIIEGAIPWATSTIDFTNKKLKFYETF